MSDRKLCVHVWRYRTLNLCDMCWRCEAEAAEKRAKDAEGDLKAERQALYEEALERDHFKEALAASQALTRILESAVRSCTFRQWQSGSGPVNEWWFDVTLMEAAQTALAESPDHVAPAPEAACVACGLPISGIGPQFCACIGLRGAAQEATASPAPERVCCFCGAGMSHGNFECPNSATILPAPPEEAAPQAQAPEHVCDSWCEEGLCPLGPGWAV